MRALAAHRASREIEMMMVEYIFQNRTKRRVDRGSGTGFAERAGRAGASEL